MSRSQAELSGKLALTSAQTAPEGQRGELVKRGINGLLMQSKEEFAKALGRAMDPDRFIRVALTQIRKSPDLTRIAAQNPLSVVGACMQIAQTGLDPSIPNEAYLIPYGAEVQAQYGYKGLAKMAMEAALNAGAPLKVLTAETICANDLYDREKGDEPRVTLKFPRFGEPRGPVVGFVAIAKDIHGKLNFEEMTLEEVKAHKTRYSKARRGPFAGDENIESYGLKTVLRRLINRNLPMSARLANALETVARTEPDGELILDGVEVLGAENSSSSTVDEPAYEVHESE